MISLSDGAWCYSPYLPTAYTISGRGPGEWVNGDISKWNLVWLTFPDHLERIRRGELQIGELAKTVNPEDFGVVAACAREEFGEVFPGLRRALHSPLPIFMNVFANGPTDELSAADLFGGRWADVVLENAGKVASKIALTIRQSAEGTYRDSQAVNTVYTATFGLPRSR